ncbi:hypothetical protein TNCV_4581411 [Trichonephila clavipes]|nr:hypothetical protein TNCV_4581411 [Trichonephila clavipes]
MLWGDVLQHAYIIRRTPNNSKQMLIEEWVLLPQEMLHQLVLSMRRRCEATIAAQAYHHTPLLLLLSKGGSMFVRFHEPVASVIELRLRNLMPLKTRRVEELMHVKTTEARLRDTSLCVILFT